MNRIQTYLDATTTHLLSEYATKNECSLSHAAGKIISSYLMCEDLDSAARIENKQQFLRMMNVLNQVLMCVYEKNKVSIPSSSPKECLDKIKQSVLEMNKG